MREVSVGIRIDAIDGLVFSGLEEVNGLINRGGIVRSIEPGGALMRQLGKNDGNVSLALSGSEMKVIVDDSAVETSPQTLEHNRVYRAGSDLIMPYMQLVDRASGNSETAPSELRRGIDLLKQAIAINPANWAAYWIIGKAHQALAESENACDAFGTSFRLNKAHPDVAREYMFECLNLGRADKAIATARHATALKPDDAGLIANLALALLIGGKLEEAADTVEKSLAIAPNDEISQNLRTIIADVQSGRRPQPSKFADLNAR